MQSGNLFQRLWARYLLILFVSLSMVLLVVYLLLEPYIFGGWRKDLHQNATFLAERVLPHTSDLSLDDWMIKWHQVQPNIRLRILDKEGLTLFDSQPWIQYAQADWTPERLMDSTSPTENFRVAVEIPFKDRTLVLSRERLLEFSENFYWYLLAAAAGLSLGIGLLSWPFAGRLGETLTSAAQLADKVAEGQFGEQLKGINRNDELGGLISALNHMSMQLVQADKKNEELVADVSHELRSPLGRIRVMTESLEYTQDEKRKTEVLKLIEHEIQALDTLVSDILVSGRLSRGEIEFELVELDLNALIDDIAIRYRATAEYENIDLKVQLFPGAALIRGDAIRLAQVVSNLVDNAFKAVRETEDPVIKIMVKRTVMGAYEVHVDDNGRGLTEQEKERIFDRFYRADKSRARHSGGAGLGLNISMQLVKAMGGELTVDIKRSAGVVFKIQGLTNMAIPA